MGNRANVVFRTWPTSPAAGAVYLYTHWGGDRLPLVVQAALAEGKRWNAPPFLAQIVLAKMLDEFARPSEKNGVYLMLSRSRAVEESVGIAPYLVDNEHPLIEIDCRDQVVRFETEGGDILREFTFEEFATEPEDALLEAWQDPADDEDGSDDEWNEEWDDTAEVDEAPTSGDEETLRESNPGSRALHEARFELLGAMLEHHRPLSSASRIISYGRAS